MSTNEYKFEITEEKNNTRLDSALAVLIPEISRTRIKNIINEGFVKINKIQITQPSIKIRSSDIVEVSIPEPKEVNISAKDIKLDIRYEDDDLLIVNKSPEMVVTEKPLEIYFFTVSKEIAILFSFISLSTTDPNIISYYL